MPDTHDAARWHRVSVNYPHADRQAVGPVELAIRQGERLLLLGPSGSGKSTLLHTLTGLVPHTIPARLTGSVHLFGQPVETRPPAGWSATVAQFFQDADQTLCGMRVEDEIAFALENRGLPEAEITRKVDAAMRLVALPEGWRKRRTMTLSGGEKQLAALAATLAQDAPLFVADEPTAHLAPAAARRLHRILMEPSQSRSVLIVDHRLDGLIGSVDRVAVLGRDGGIVADGPPAPFFRQHRDLLASLGVWRPFAVDLDAQLAKDGLAPQEPPLEVGDVLRHLEHLPASETRRAVSAVEAFVAVHSADAISARPGGIVAQLVAADCAPLFGPTVLRNVDVEIRSGEILGILGANGAGKSTLGASLAGLLKLKGGRREGATGGIAFQNPENQFVAGSVREEILSSLGGKMPLPDRLVQTDRILAGWGLGGLQDRHPFELSQGQKRRLALAALRSTDRWKLLVLDEPTAGLDSAGTAMIANCIVSLRRKGHAVAVITHDMDFALRVCVRSIIVGDGGILAEGRTSDLLVKQDLLHRAGLAEPALMPAIRWLEHELAC